MQQYRCAAQKYSHTGAFLAKERVMGSEQERDKAQPRSAPGWASPSDGHFGLSASGPVFQALCPLYSRCPWPQAGSIWGQGLSLYLCFHDISSHLWGLRSISWRQQWEFKATSPRAATALLRAAGHKPSLVPFLHWVSVSRSTLLLTSALPRVHFQLGGTQSHRKRCTISTLFSYQ